jgi:hypothetical protein
MSQSVLFLDIAASSFVSRKKNTTDILQMWYFRPRGMRMRRSTSSCPFFFVGTTSGDALSEAVVSYTSQAGAWL